MSYVDEDVRNVLFVCE